MIQTILTLLFTWAFINIENSSNWWLIFGFFIGLFWTHQQKNIDKKYQQELLPDDCPANRTTEKIYCSRTLFLFLIIVLTMIIFWTIIHYL